MEVMPVNTNSLTVSQRDLWQLVDAAFDIMHPEIHRHHQQVSYLAYQMAHALSLPTTHQLLILQSAYLHDIGGAVDGQKVSLTDIENASYHVAQVSANILVDFPAFESISAIVRHSQTPYRETRQLRLAPLHLPAIDKSELPEEISDLVEKVADITVQDPLILSNLIQLADDVALMIKPDAPILNQVDRIMAAARRGSGDLYAPKAVEALEKLAGSEYVWLELAYSSDRIAVELMAEGEAKLDTIKQVSKLIGMIIDFRSPFTAMHSAGVAASARALARLAGMNAQECDMMEIAGSLHDLGKIRTPSEILEKPGKLTDEEFNVMKEHAFFSDLLLGRVTGFNEIRGWAALHHEKLNGKGYPYHLKEGEIPFGAQIMAVADVFSAITEDRPYRKGMPEEKVKAILQENAERGELSRLITDLLIANFDVVNAARDRASQDAGGRYFRAMAAPSSLFGLET